jgi:HPt (histidine-containing phosphotransfer) domain-containing protein
MPVDRSANVAPPLDRREALERVGGDPAFLEELLSLYVREFGPALEALRQAAKGKDFQTIRERGHSLKGSSANLSLPGLRAAAYDAELAGREENLASARSSIERLKEEFERLTGFLTPSPAPRRASPPRPRRRP